MINAIHETFLEFDGRIMLFLAFVNGLFATMLLQSDQRISLDLAMFSGLMVAINVTIILLLIISRMVSTSPPLWFVIVGAIIILVECILLFFIGVYWFGSPSMQKLLGFAAAP